MLAAIKSVEANGDELEKIRRLTAKHDIGYNRCKLEEAINDTNAALGVLFGSVRNAIGDTTSTNNELFESLKKRADNN